VNFRRQAGILHPQHNKAPPFAGYFAPSVIIEIINPEKRRFSSGNRQPFLITDH
jgi:hypothetical protein